MKPDREEVLRMAREAGIPGYPDELERFYALAYEAGARAEREECAKVCEDKWIYSDSEANVKEALATAIRARTT